MIDPARSAVGTTVTVIAVLEAAGLKLALSLQIETADTIRIGNWHFFSFFSALKRDPKRWRNEKRSLPQGVRAFQRHALQGRIRCNDPNQNSQFTFTSS
jgi:hypothetical protein